MLIQRWKAVTSEKGSTELVGSFVVCSAYVWIFEIFYKNPFRDYFITKIVKGAGWEEFHENMESQTPQPGRGLRVTYPKPS